MRWTGLILIAISCGGLGFRAAGMLRGRIRECRYIEQSFVVLAAETRYGQLPMAEALRRAVRRGGTADIMGAAGAGRPAGAVGAAGAVRTADTVGAAGTAGAAWAEFFLRTAARLERCEEGTFCRIWQEELASYLQVSVLREESGLLQEIGTQLGSLDLEEQCMAIERFLQRWRDEICELQEQEKREGHLYRSLGICAGLFLVLVLI